MTAPQHGPEYDALIALTAYGDEEEVVVYDDKQSVELFAFRFPEKVH